MKSDRILSTFFVLAIGGCIAVAVTPATRADTVVLGAVKDATIYEENDRTANGSGSYFFAGNNDRADTRRGLLRFDLGSIPAGSTINSVTLRLYMSRTQAGNTAVTLHRLLDDWTEGPSDPGGQEGGGASAELNDVTWRYRSYDPNNEGGSPQWSPLGGAYVSGASASTVVGGNGAYQWTAAAMATDVQGWLAAPSTNFGWIVRGVETGQKTAKRFNSRTERDTTRRPMLTIDFTPPAATGACCFPGETCQDLDISVCNEQGGTFQGSGTDCATTTCVDPLGACCSTDSPWGCTEVSQFDCEAQAGNYVGDGETCGPIEAIGGCPVILEPYVDALPVPLPAPPEAGDSGGLATYHIGMQQVSQRLHRDLPDTTVWGYGVRPDPFDPATPYASFPGPTIEAAVDEPVRIRYFNDLPPTHYLPVDTCAHGADDQSSRAVVHLHGGHVEQQYDGYPEATFLPGEEAAICVTDPLTTCTSDADCPTPGRCDGDGSTCTTDADCVGLGGAENCLLCEPGYEYPNQQNASMIWFHDHALGITRLNVYMGMAALYVLRDEFEQSLGLPAPWPQLGDPPGMTYYELPLVIQDRSFRSVSPLGGLRYADGWTENFFGDTAVINGKVWPFLDVDQGKYRFRLLNGSNSRAYQVSLDRLGVDGIEDLPFHVIGVDGGLLSETVTVNRLTMGPAERYDVIVDFGCADPPTCSAPLPPGTEIVLTNSATSPAGDLPNLMKFVVQDQVGFTGPIPTTLRPVDPLDPTGAVRTRQFLLRKSQEPCAGSRWEIRTLDESGVTVGALWDDVTEYPQLGTTEIWEFVNPTVVPHPMHMHLVFFQILNRQDFEIVDDQVIPLGDPIPPAPEEAGWKDTARAEPGQILRVIARFEDYEGLYAYHCHILEHEDHEMMRQFRTVGGVDLRMNATEIVWPSEPGATGYDIVRGDLATLRATGGDFVQATDSCVLDGQPVNVWSFAGDPLLADGAGYWYLSRTRDAVGKGTYESGWASQIDARDSEIEASGQDCP